MKGVDIVGAVCTRALTSRMLEPQYSAMQRTHLRGAVSPPAVSFDDEPLVLVNDADEEVGFDSKQRCHDGDGLLHRAFSVFLFSADGQVLLQQRSGQKRLWPGAWSNTCCSHPRRGETVNRAVHRRLREELALEAPVRFLYKFRYHAQGAEHELCHVYAGLLIGQPAVNANEIAATAMMPAAALDREVATRPELYTPWLKLEWAQVRGDKWPIVQEFLRVTMCVGGGMGAAGIVEQM